MRKTTNAQRAAEIAARVKAVPAVSNLTPQEMREKEMDMIRRQLHRIVQNVEEREKEMRERMIANMQKGYMIDYSTTRELALAQYKLRHVAQFIGKSNLVLTLPLNEILDRFARLEESLTDRVLMNARGAMNCGEMNSTDHISRAFATIDITAMAGLLQEVKGWVCEGRELLVNKEA